MTVSFKKIQNNYSKFVKNIPYVSIGYMVINYKQGV